MHPRPDQGWGGEEARVGGADVRPKYESNMQSQQFVAAFPFVAPPASLLRPGVTPSNCTLPDQYNTTYT